VRSIERTACRAGLLASGDVNVAARLLAVDGRAVGGLTAADRIRDLLGFSIGSSYARLRRALGVAVKGPIPNVEVEIAIEHGFD
jgi:hypothetical protein